MPKSGEITHQTAVYTFGAQLTQLITLAAAILSRRFLGPTQVGIWATLQIIVEYAKYASMGSLYAVAKEIPYYAGKGRADIAEEIKNVVFTIVLGSSFIIGCGICLFAFLTRGRFSPEVTYGLFLVSAIILLQRLSDLLIQLLRCYKKFTLASSQMIWSAIVNAVLVAVLTYFFQIYGFMWAMILSFLFNMIYIYAHHQLPFRIRFPRERVRAVVALGFPLMLVGVMTTVLRSIDKISVAKFLGFEAMGYYSIAVLVSSYIQTFYNSIAVVLFPHFQEKFSLQDDPRDLREFLHKATYAYALTTPILIGLAWIVAPFFIGMVLPQFVPGIAAMKILCLSMFFLALAQPYSDFLITIKKHLILFPLLAVTAAVALPLTLWVIHAGYGITGVASVMTFAGFFNFSVTYFFAARYFTGGRAALEKYFKFLGCGAYLALILLILGRLFSTAGNSFLGMTAEVLLFLAFYSPLFWVLNRKFSLTAFMKEKFARSRAKPALSELEMEKETEKIE